MRSWTGAKKTWVQVINNLFEQMFGNDFLTYCYDKDHGTRVEDTVTSSILEYCHDHWESQYGVHITLQPQQDLSGKCHPIAINLDSYTDMLNESTPLQDLCGKCDTIATSVVVSDTDMLNESTPPQALSAKCQPIHLATNLDLDSAMLNEPASILSPESQTAKCSLESVSSHSSPQLKATVVVEDRDETILPQQTSLQIAMAKASTRGEEAALHSLLPPLASRFPLTLRPAYGKTSNADPFLLKERPCESDIQKAQKVLHDARKAGMNPTGVDIVGKGWFSESALCILKRFCTLADTSRKVAAEANWLSKMKCSSEDLVRLQDALWHHPTNHPILKYGKKGLDSTSFSDLVEERYIDSFVIDICISKFLDDAREEGKNDTVYFPTEFYDWMSCNDKNFQQLQLREATRHISNVDDLHQILVPVYMPNHWGLIFVDLAQKEMYFDDGLQSAVPTMSLPSVKWSLELLSEMYPHHPSFQTRFWKNYRMFQRFGMPSQAPINSKMVGVGSCGIGVIMAARDIIQNGSLCINKFQWRFSDMDKHRKTLMLQILDWSTP